MQGYGLFGHKPEVLLRIGLLIALVELPFRASLTAEKAASRVPDPLALGADQEGILGVYAKGYRLPGTTTVPAGTGRVGS